MIERCQKHYRSYKTIVTYIRLELAALFKLTIFLITLGGRAKAEAVSKTVLNKVQTVLKEH